MRNTLVASIVAVFCFFLVGCATAPMTAHSKLDVGGDIDVVEKTTTTTINADGTTVTETVEKTIHKTPAAGDLELKEKELQGRTEVGKANAQSDPCVTYWLKPSYCQYGTGFQPMGPTSPSGAVAGYGIYRVH